MCRPCESRGNDRVDRSRCRRCDHGCRAPAPPANAIMLPSRRFSRARRRNSTASPIARPHVVADPLADNDPWLDCAVDWDRTIAFREHLWGLGLGVAEAMDTAQRGMGARLDGAAELIRARSKPQGKAGRHRSPRGAGTDQLDPAAARRSTTSFAPMRSRSRRSKKPGGRIVLMASARTGARRAQARTIMRSVYAPHPAPGETAGDHPLARRDVRSRARRLLGRRRPRRGDGYCACDHPRPRRQDRRHQDFAAVKDKEISMRSRLKQGVRMYTGDDFNYAELIAGDDARLFRRAARHLRCDCAGRLARRLRSSQAAMPGLRRDFGADGSAVAPHLQGPTRFYKTGVVFWPGSMACRTISPWSAARKARGRCCILPNFSVWPTRRACCEIRNRQFRACAPCWRSRGIEA